MNHQSFYPIPATFGKQEAGRIFSSSTNFSIENFENHAFPAAQALADSLCYCSARKSSRSKFTLRSFDISKEATPDYPVHELVRKRFSPYAFDSRPVSLDDLRSLFEAARWAASSYNEQPWSYLVATGDDPEQFQKVLGCLVEGNQGWAGAAPVLAIAVASTRFSRNDNPNKAAHHDLGLAAGNLSFEATARGLYVNQMIGILADKAKVTFEIPDGHEALTALAIGYRADPATLSDPLRQRETAPRARKPPAEFVFSGKFGTTSPIVS